MFAGLVDEDEGVDAVEEEDRLTFYAKRGRNPIDGAAAQLSSTFARAYHGGLNSCPMPGYYPVPTVDIDAQNDYPAAMACVEYLDWEEDAIEEVFHETWLARDTAPSPTTPFVGFVSFKFPQDVMHPCLPMVTDGTLVYPRTSEGTAGTWVCGPELSLALQLGAEVYSQIGFLGRALDGPDDGRSLSLRRGVKQLIDDCNVAKRLFGKGSIEEQTLKTGVNSVYGKTAQNVAEQRVCKIGVKKVSKAAQRVNVVLDKADELVVEVGCIERRLQILEGKVTRTAVARLSLALLPLAAALLAIGAPVIDVAYAAELGPLLGWAWGSFSAAEAWWPRYSLHWARWAAYQRLVPSSGGWRSDSERTSDIGESHEIRETRTPQPRGCGVLSSEVPEDEDTSIGGVHRRRRTMLRCSETGHEDPWFRG